MDDTNYTLDFHIAVVKSYLSGLDEIKRTARILASRNLQSSQLFGIDGISWIVTGYMQVFKLNILKTLKKKINFFVKQHSGSSCPIRK